MSKRTFPQPPKDELPAPTVRVSIRLKTGLSNRLLALKRITLRSRTSFLEEALERDLPRHEKLYRHALARLNPKRK